MHFPPFFEPVTDKRIEKGPDCIPILRSMLSICQAVTASLFTSIITPTAASIGKARYTLLRRQALSYAGRFDVTGLVLTFISLTVYLLTDITAASLISWISFFSRLYSMVNIMICVAA